MRQLHTDLIKMAIEDPELQSVWPDIAPGVAGSKKDLYCNLILNLLLSGIQNSDEVRV
jgi:hypothetical protein